MKIFLVEDDIDLNNVMFETFSNLGYEIVTYKDGSDAFNNLNSNFDLYIVDINLPNVNGMELIKHIRIKFENANIFVISGNNNIETILEAYDVGCNDYIKKPFDLREIIAKIKNTLRVIPKNIILSKECEYNKKEKKIIKDDQIIILTNKEALLLELLLDNVNQIVSNIQIENYVWGDSYGSGYVKQLVSKLRNKLPCKILKYKVSNGYKIEINNDYN